METTQQETPALFEHCCTVYDNMLETAEPVEEGKLYIWEGYLTHLFKEIGFGIPRYSRIVGMMQQMGVIEQVTRGAGGKPSKWYIHKQPKLEDFEYAKEREKDEEEKQAKQDPVEQRLNGLRDMVLTLTDRVDDLELELQLLRGDSNGTAERYAEA